MKPAAATVWGGISAALALCALLLAAIARAEGNAVVFQSTDTPPYWSASLPGGGHGGSLLQLVSASAGVPYSMEYLPVKRFQSSLATYMVGDPDILENLKHRAIFPIGIFHSAFFYYKPRHEAINFHSLSELRGYTLGVLRGTLEDRDYFSRNGIAVEESDSVESLLRKLHRGRIDFCVVVAGAGRYAIRQQFPQEAENFVQEIIPGSARPLSIMIDVADPEGSAVAQRYRRALKKVLHSPEYHAMLERYYGAGHVPGDIHERLNGFIRFYASMSDDQPGGK